MKIKILITTIICAVLTCILPFSVNAQTPTKITIEGYATEYNTFAEAYTAAKPDSTILVPEGTYDIGESSIDKNISIKGTGRDKTILTGNLLVNANLKLDDLTLTYLGKVTTISTLNILKKTTVTLNNVKISNTYEVGSAVRISFTGSGSAVTINNSVLTGKYGLTIRSSEVTTNISDSEISGYAAIDAAATNTTNSGKPTEKNKINVKNSTLVGINNFGTSLNNNEYSTIVIGGQKDGIFVFDNTTITNNVSTTTGRGNSEHLIDTANGYYLKNENTTLVITNSTLKNTDAIHKSYVYSFGDIINNKIELTNNKIETINDQLYTAIPSVGGKDYFYVTYEDADGTGTVTMAEKDTLLTAPVTVEKEGHTFDGWYNGTEKFDFTTKIVGNTTLTAKYIKNEESPEVVNPSTGDSTITYGIIVLLGLAGVTYATLKLKKS